MKQLLFISLFVFAATLIAKESNAQVLDGIYVKEHVPARKPASYKYLREGDVMWSKRVWRIIDLREKINHPIYYPTTQIGDRMSLIDLLLWGINTEGIVAYSSDDDRFTQPISRTQIETNFGAIERPITFTDADGNEVTKSIKEEMVSSQVKQYIVKEDWFFDKQHSIMDVRIIGIAPVRFYLPDEAVSIDGEAEMRRSVPLWIYFPEARRILANHEIFNQNNDAERRTYDDLFFKRKFNSYIIREANVHDDRGIQEYSIGIKSLLESETIKGQMFDYEQDLWNY